ncbi:MAG: signal peptidase I [Oscillospiraceae bacterium]|nr:signal peptidase I [Oscillospiraceae bacterium]
MKKRSVKRIASNIFLIIAALILIYAIYAVVQTRRTGEEVFIFGFKPYIIQTGSMEPDLRVNSLIVVRQGGFDRVQVGDDISYRAPGFDVNVCHRVIEITEEGFHTQGINNNQPDEFVVTEEDFVGIVVFNSNITVFIIYAFQNHPVITILTILVVVMVFVAIKILLSSPKGKRAL